MCKALSVKFELISQLIKQSKICCSSLLSIFKHVAERMYVKYKIHRFAFTIYNSYKIQNNSYKIQNSTHMCMF